MTSDWRVLPEPLGRVACNTCALAIRLPGRGVTTYEHGYGLYAHAPDSPREMVRQARYARWIADHAGATPSVIVDVGCGNGSLLLALASHWPDATLLGCDLSGESVAHGTAAGLQLWQGGLRERPRGVTPELVVSVNVIEHTPDPVAFLGEMRDALAEGGTLALICPDGSRPGVELLIADHLYSFTTTHLRALMRQVGLTVVHTSTAPEDVGAFQLVTARAGRPGGDVDLTPPARLAAARQAYLEQWQGLDTRLHDRVSDDVTCFGVGETAGLLRAYAPDTWSLVRSCTSDEPSAEHFDGIPIESLDGIPATRSILLGVRPRDQEMVAARLRSSFRQIVTWYDLVDEG